MLGAELGYRVNTYTAETPLAKRETLRRQFESGQLQGLVAIRCLDEGVDIPAIQTAVILASSSNPPVCAASGTNFTSLPWQGMRHLI